jgi:hypothetical protein
LLHYKYYTSRGRLDYIRTYMKVEINLWLNPGRKFRGLVNINRGQLQTKIPCLLHRELFITQGVDNDIGDFNDLDESPAFEDRDAKYCWIDVPGGGFVSWNEKETFMKIFANNEHTLVPLLRKVRTGLYKNQPDISFRNYNG